MKDKSSGPQVIPLVKTAVNTLFSNPLILLPFITIAFIQLLVLEILYFSPRFPLNKFFGPLIERMWGPVFLHYPQNFVILPKLFQLAQIPIYIFVSSFLIGVAISIIATINNGKKISFSAAIQNCWSQYVHLVVSAVISFFAFYALYSLYGLVMQRALIIRSVSGIFYLIKVVVLQGAPYISLIIGVFITTSLAFVLPLIIIEKKKVFSAFLINFKTIWRHFIFLFFVVLVPTMFYLPVFLLRNNVEAVAAMSFEGMRLIVIIIGVLMMMLIDSTVYTAITSFYLLKREEK